ncbi:MAG: MoaD/ThiS family protein [Gammaproteobacteria bacterium]|nr:MoaD/ThiS family protein [Gammaproteobacteria bacterium]
MRIKLKLFATLGDHLPAGAQENAIQIEVPDDATPNQVIDRFKVPRKMAHLVLVNGIFVDPAHRDEGRLKDGDVLAVWPPVAGG